jgi:hypothetical protein
MLVPLAEQSCHGLSPVFPHTRHRVNVQVDCSVGSANSRAQACKTQTLSLATTDAHPITICASHNANCRLSSHHRAPAPSQAVASSQGIAGRRVHAAAIIARFIADHRRMTSRRHTRVESQVRLSPDSSPTTAACRHIIVHPRRHRPSRPRRASRRHRASQGSHPRTRDYRRIQQACGSAR